jgi:hypothetical protein
MAKTKELVGSDSNVSIAVGAEMPEVELGHKGYELAGGKDIFDPNAARRLAEGRGPGLQDSEIKDPAHWVQPISLEEAAQARVSELERELSAAKADLAEAKKA